MRLKIVQAGDPVLRAQTRQLTRQEIMSDEIQRLVKDMRETMQDAPGVGLAAPKLECRCESRWSKIAESC